MRLLFLSADNLRNGPFIKDLVYHFKGAGKCILLHDHFGSIADTRFVTKRVSALISEEMILNNGFSGDQRGIFHRLLQMLQQLIGKDVNPTQVSLLITAPEQIHIHGFLAMEIYHQ